LITKAVIELELVEPPPIAATPFTETAPPVGAVESFVSVRVNGAALLALSRPVTVSDGELDVLLLQLKALEVYGYGLDTISSACVVHPVAESAPNSLDAGPDRESVSAFWILNDPAVEPWYQSVVPDRNEPPDWLTSVSTFVGGTLSTVTDWFGEVPVLPAWSDCVAVSVYVVGPWSGARLFAPDVPVLHEAGEPVHGAFPDCGWSETDPSVTDQWTDAVSPVAVPHDPPKTVTFWLVVYGKVRGLPLTVVSDTDGAVMSIVSDLLPELPVLLAASDCVAASV
jgi:hypothetical protein